MNINNVIKLIGTTITVFAIVASGVFAYGRLSNQVIVNKCDIESITVRYAEITSTQYEIKESIVGIETNMEWIKRQIQLNPSMAFNYQP